ncbi:hypothetical protein [Phytohabitans houttuyneae]|uniref:DUF222 domain-containing protein n=1 Tax=Phytohabitans houttuyneae TaxID=1076126 RepID=A0A6V8KID6_9ACTN|nr:hypothetical protein [Phytohabitans houttuyneae]GFJ84963.1 hypothetical protein Phou_091430 [Phytohabitans houttuyneae]
MTPDPLFDLAAEFAQATGNAERHTAYAACATGDEHISQTEKAATWTALAARRREELRAALRETLHGTVRAVPDQALPVATWQRGRVEVRAVTTDGARTVRVRYTPGQALETGAALIACAAATDERIGGTLTRTLAALPSHLDTEPTPTAPVGEEPTADRPTGAGREVRDA